MLAHARTPLQPELHCLILDGEPLGEQDELLVDCATGLEMLERVRRTGLPRRPR